MFKRTRVALMTLLVIAGSLLTAGTAFAWQPLSIGTDCASISGGNFTWTIKASQTEADLNVEFSTDNFATVTTLALDSVTLQVTTTAPTSFTTVYVRWAGDHSVSTIGYAPDNCVKVAPTAKIGGPCADPSYYGIFDNSASTEGIQFRIRWYTTTGLHAARKFVPAGDIYDTWIHWAKPGTLVRVAYKDPTSGLWINLGSLTSVKGRFPPCDYTPGWQQQPV